MITTTLEGVKEKINTYPIIKKSKTTETIILFTEKDTGVVLSDTSKSEPCDVGYFLSSWNESNFVAYNKPITIQNKK